MLDRLARVVERAQVRALKARLHACGENVAIYMPVVFSGPEAIDIGSHTSIAPFVHIWGGGRVTIGSRCMIGSHVAISSLTHDYTQADMRHTIVDRPVHIGDEVWIGAHSVILPGVSIGRGAVIGAGSVVTRDVDPFAVVYGVPARQQRERQFDPALARSVTSLHELGPNSILLGGGWYPVEQFDGLTFRWAASGAEILVGASPMSHQTLRIDLEPGPGVSRRPCRVSLVSSSGDALADAQLDGRAELSISLDLPKDASTVLRLCVQGSGKPVVGDARALDIRVFSVGWA